MKKGVYQATKKDGTQYYRSSFTYLANHISLGSFLSEEDAHQCYLEANSLINTTSIKIDDHRASNYLTFRKWVTLINLRDNHIYFPSPIYVRSSFFSYFLDEHIELKFDMEDLFYYSNKQIMRRNGHLFVSDYGMQVNILNRYGIKNYGVKEIDYVFVNGDDTDFRYSNIKIKNIYHGVREILIDGNKKFQTRIHINGYYVIGIYDTNIEAAIAYNKAVDILNQNGNAKKYMTNFIDEITNKKYAEIYIKIPISEKIMTYQF